jgi:hypothetical protein
LFGLREGKVWNLVNVTERDRTTSMFVCNWESYDYGLFGFMGRSETEFSLFLWFMGRSEPLSHFNVVKWEHSGGLYNVRN